MKQPRRKLRRIRGRIGVSMIGNGLDANRSELSVLLAGEFGSDVIVARERVGLQVLHSIFDPLDRLACQHRSSDRNYVTRINRYLAAKSTTNVRRDDLNPLFRKADVSGNERKDSADRVR